MSSLDSSRPRFLGHLNELDGLGRVVKKINIASWFRGHRRPCQESSVALPLTTKQSDTDLKDRDLESEYARVSSEISVIQDVQRYHVGMLFKAQTFKEGVVPGIANSHEWLDVREESQVEQRSGIERIERGLANVETRTASPAFEFSDFSHESLVPINNQSRLSKVTGLHFPSVPNQRPISTSEAERSLDTYNQKWEMLQENLHGHSPLPGGMALIPWPSHLDPSPALSRTPPGRPATDSSRRQGVYVFFCAPFGIHPTDSTLTFPARMRGIEENIHSLERLCLQLELETLRWREDNVAALFGGAAAAADRVGFTRSAIMELKARVDEELSRMANM